MTEPAPPASFADAARSVSILDWLLLVLAVVSIGLLSWETWGNVSPETSARLIKADYAICAIFAVEFLWRWSEDGWTRRYLVRNWYEILGMIPVSEPALRAFELLLLREIGLLPALDAQTMTLAPLIPGERYALVPEGGLVRQDAGDSRPCLYLNDDQCEALGITTPKRVASLPDMPTVLESGVPLKSYLNGVKHLAGDIQPELLVQFANAGGAGHVHLSEIVAD